MLDSLKVPAGAVLVICKEVKDALNLVPDGVVLTVERYQALLDRIEKLERQLNPGKPGAPSSCKLSGKLEGDTVRVQAQFDFRTTRPNALVALGCQRAWPQPGPTLDGQLPLILNGDDGLVVQVETPGVHRLSLEVKLPLTTRGTTGTDLGFDLDLPQAAITSLDQFTLPKAVPEVRLNGRTVRVKPADAENGRVERVSLGAVDRLALSWKGPATQTPKGASLQEAMAEIAVRLDETWATTEAVLTLQVLRGDTRSWRIQVPPNANLEVREPRLQHERIEGIDLPDARNPVLTIRLKEASADPLRVVLLCRQPWLKTPVPIGPFVVLDTPHQQGTIRVSAPADLRLRYQLRGDTGQRELPEDARRDNAVAEFVYWNLPAPAVAGQLPPAPLELTAETIKGSVEARAEHTLQLTRNGWQISSKIYLTPVHTKMAGFEIAVPADYVFDGGVGAMPADLVESVDIKDRPPGRVAQVKLAREQTQAFAVTLPGWYSIPDKEKNGPVPVSGRRRLVLPRPAHVLDRGGQVTATVPEGFELLALETGPEAPLPGEKQHTWRFERIPDRIDLAWQLHRAEMPVERIVDVNLAWRQALVSLRLQLQPAHLRDGRVSLLIPPALNGRVRVTQGGVLGRGDQVTVAAPSAKEYVMLLEYSFLLSEKTGTRIQVPLVRPLQATRMDTKVRVWADDAVLPALASGPWEEQRLEVVPGRDSYPALVLRSDRLDGSLTLAVNETPAARLLPIVIDHALIQVQVAEDGSQRYRARFLLSRVHARTLDLGFPAPLSRLKPEFFLDHKKLTRWQPIAGDQEGIDTAGARLEITPELYHNAVILEVVYEVAPGHVIWSSPWQLTLQPPVLRDADVLLGRVRWQVQVPTSWVALYQGRGFGQRWVWQGGMLTPRAAVSSTDLERWLYAGLTPYAQAEHSADTSGSTDEGEPQLAFWRSGLEPVSLIHVAQQLWLLACSLLFLAIGLGLAFAPLPRSILVACVCLIALASTLAGIWFPTMLSNVIYGCQPGAVVFVLILAVQWTLQRRYRRQVVFLPAFTRLKTPSSVAHPVAADQPRGEPSTVDEPPAKRGSSIKQKV
jgi:hypothetical protein